MPRVTPPLDQLKPFSFDDLAFPYRSYRVSGGIRKHKHEYPHNPGAAVEKLGRDLYEINVSVNFTGGLVVDRYSDLLVTLGALREEFEQQTTAALNIPHIGTIQACADKWVESVTNTNRSTISADLTFYEDLNSALAFKDTVFLSAGSIGSLAQALDILTKPLDPVYLASSFKIQPIGPNSVSIWDAINDLSVTIAGIQDQSDLYGALVASKIEGLIALFKQADTQISQLNDPDNWPVVDAMHSLWETALVVQSDLQNTGFQAQLYVTPVRMGIADVSVAIYGNSLQAAQLMQLNDCGGNPLSIPPDTQILYYTALAV